MKQLNFGTTNGVPNDPNKTVVHCPFEKGDKVYHIYYGWGVVQSISEEDNKDFPVLVDFEGQLEEFTKGGQFYFDVPPTLSFTEYTLQGFSQERPKELDFDASCLPAWANWIVLCRGDWYWSYYRPRTDGDQISFNSAKGMIPTSFAPKNFTGDWKDSLHEIKDGKAVKYSLTNPLEEK